MPELERFKRSPDLDWDQVWAAFDRDGGLIVEDFIAPELLARLQREVAPLITHRYRSLDAVPDAFAGDHRSPEYVKGVVLP